MGALKIVLICLLVLATFASAASSRRNSDANISTDLAETNEQPSLIATISSLVVEWLSRAIQYMFEFFDLKVRSVKFLTSLYTTDNLILLKKFLNIGLRFGGWLYELIPDSTNEGASSFLSFLFPQSNQKEEDDYAFEDPFLASASSYDSSIGSSSDSSYTRSNDFNTIDNNEDNGDTYASRYGKQVMNLHTLINARGKFSK